MCAVYFLGLLNKKNKTDLTRVTACGETDFSSDTERKLLGAVTHESGDDTGNKKCDIHY